MYDTLPDQPIPVADLDPPAIADVLSRAADLIDRDGLYRGDWWPNAILLRWEPCAPVDVTGAIGVAAGYRQARDIDYVIVGVEVFDVERRRHVQADPHPAFAALMRDLGATEVEQLFRWADDARQQDIVDRLRTCAASIRIQAQLGARPTAWVTA